MSGRTPAGYTVYSTGHTCNDLCRGGVQCTQEECGHLCYHMYRCDAKCYEYTNGHLCKHIHRVHSMVCARVCKPETHMLHVHDSNWQTDVENSSSESELDPLEYTESTSELVTGTKCFTNHTGTST